MTVKYKQHKLKKMTKRAADEDAVSFTHVKNFVPSDTLQFPSVWGTLKPDLVINTKDGSVLAHKFVVTSCSSVFRDLMYGDNSNNVTINDISCDYMNIIVRYMYKETLCLEPNAKVLLQLTKWADYFNMPSLEDNLIAGLLKLLKSTYWRVSSHNHFFGILVRFYGTASVKMGKIIIRDIALLILNFGEEIRQTEAYKDLSKHTHDLILTAISELLSAVPSLNGKHLSNMLSSNPKQQQKPPFSFSKPKPQIENIHGNYYFLDLTDTTFKYKLTEQS